MSRPGVTDQFTRDVAEHQLTVIRDDDLYRHLRLARPGTGINHFDIVTWPGHLSLGGDRDGFVFARIPDMFEFFRAKSGWNTNSINPQYWAEKLTVQVPVKTYDVNIFRQYINGAINDAADDYPGLAGHARRLIRYAESDGAFEREDDAREWLRDFKFVVPAVVPVRQFQFLDTWECDFTDWDFHYLYACHAIQWGIDQYDAHIAQRSDRLISALIS